VLIADRCAGVLRTSWQSYIARAKVAEAERAMCCAALCWRPPVYVAFFYLSCSASRQYTAMGCASLCNVAFTQAMLQACCVHRVGSLRPWLVRAVIRPILILIGWIVLTESGGCVRLKFWRSWC
jgi:hypothetical protein